MDYSVANAIAAVAGIISASSIAITDNFMHMKAHNSSHAKSATYNSPNKPTVLVIPQCPATFHSTHPS